MATTILDTALKCSSFHLINLGFSCLNVKVMMYLYSSITRALREARPPWPRQYFTPIFSGFPIWKVTIVIQITPKTLVSCSLYNCRVILKISSKSVDNLLSHGRISGSPPKFSQLFLLPPRTSP